MISALTLALGLVLLVVGADALVRGVSSIALRLGVPALVIGLTVVAFGTSLPEVVVNVTAALKDQPALVFGNVTGSSMVNLGFVLAMTAIIRPLKVEASIVTRELPILLLITAVFVALSSDRWLTSATGDVLSRGDGVVLLLLFVGFLYTVVRVSITAVRAERAGIKPDPLIEEVEVAEAKTKPLRPGVAVVLTVLGIVAVAGGGRFAVQGAVALAQSFGVSEAIIGLTIVSLGTTLPELVTCVMAARRGQGDIALGNVVGSNIFNVLFIGGLASTIRPVPLPEGGLIDALAVLFFVLISLPIALRGSRITRIEGVLLLSCYVSYMTYRVLGQGQ
jgi:cation:H+ antiporter